MANDSKVLALFAIVLSPSMLRPTISAAAPPPVPAKTICSDAMSPSPRWVIPYGTSDVYLPGSLSVVRIYVEKPRSLGRWRGIPEMHPLSLRLATLGNLQRNAFVFGAKHEIQSPFGDLFGSSRTQTFVGIPGEDQGESRPLRLVFDQRALMQDPSIRSRGLPVDRLELWANKTPIAAVSFVPIENWNAETAPLVLKGSEPVELLSALQTAHFSAMWRGRHFVHLRELVTVDLEVPLDGSVEQLVLSGPVPPYAAALLYANLVHGNLRSNHPIFSFEPIRRIAELLQGREGEFGNAEDQLPSAPPSPDTIFPW